MPRDIVLAVDVLGTPTEVFAAITTQEGQASFWTEDCDVGDAEARFGFPGAPADLRMRIDAAEPDRLVRWTCLGDFPGWDGSTIEWELSLREGTRTTTVVVFRHLGLHGPNEADAELGSVAQVWAMVLNRLQSYVRVGHAVPYFPDESG